MGFQLDGSSLPDEKGNCRYFWVVAAKQTIPRTLFLAVVLQSLLNPIFSHRCRVIVSQRSGRSRRSMVHRLLPARHQNRSCRGQQLRSFLGAVFSTSGGNFLVRAWQRDRTSPPGVHSNAEPASWIAHGSAIWGGRKPPLFWPAHPCQPTAPQLLKLERRGRGQTVNTPKPQYRRHKPLMWNSPCPLNTSGS
jgi:hypothetical protein